MPEPVPRPIALFMPLSMTTAPPLALRMASTAVFAVVDLRSCPVGRGLVCRAVVGNDASRGVGEIACAVEGVRVAALVKVTSAPVPFAMMAVALARIRVRDSFLPLSVIKPSPWLRQSYPCLREWLPRLGSRSPSRRCHWR